MKITVEQLSKIAGRPVNDNMHSVVAGLDMLGARVGLDLPHRLSQFVAQLAHESGAFRYDREVWGPTPAQQKYDTRVDLGNTPERDGDGKKNAGRGPIQVTGGYNIRKLYAWCVKMFGAGVVPDFVKNPDLINTDPWEGLSAIWYWTEGNPEGKSLNRYADSGDTEMITRRINGGLNGFADRLRYVTRASLVLLGREPGDIAGFQSWAQGKGYLPAGADQVDGIDGPKTRAALHKALVALAEQKIADENIEVKSAPVTEVEEKVVVPPGSDKRSWLWAPLSGISLSGAINTFADFPWQYKLGLSIVAFALVVLMLFIGERIIRRAKAVIAEAAK